MQPIPADDFADMQGLLRSGFGKLVEASFLLLRIADPAPACAWLSAAPVTSAAERHQTTALQIALSAEGLRALHLPQTVLGAFSAEFVSGMAGQDSRSRRLGDIGANAPANWRWGAEPPHVLVMLYAGEGQLAAWQDRVRTPAFAAAFGEPTILHTSNMHGKEPFGFADGVSQPSIDWHAARTVDADTTLPYGNLISAGEFVLGYPNEYGQYTDRPLLDSADDLPPAADDPARRDLGRNGSYLVFRELRQDVGGFWRFMAETAGAEAATALAETMVGRRMDGTPLVSASAGPIEGVDDAENRFTYADDPAGLRCPIGAHIRRANPRTDDIPGAPTGLARLSRMLNIVCPDLRQDLIAASRFHRLLRRGREYGSTLAPADAMRPDAAAPVAGLHFICLNASIARQFEFIQGAWLASPKFAGLDDEADPLLGNRAAPGTAYFSRPQTNGLRTRVAGLPPFVTVAGGGYFFLPGLRALRWLADPRNASGGSAHNRRTP